MITMVTIHIYIFFNFVLFVTTVGMMMLAKIIAKKLPLVPAVSRPVPGELGENVDLTLEFHRGVVESLEMAKREKDSRLYQIGEHGKRVEELRKQHAELARKLQEARSMAFPPAELERRNKPNLDWQAANKAVQVSRVALSKAEAKRTEMLERLDAVTKALMEVDTLDARAIRDFAKCVTGHLAHGLFEDDDCEWVHPMPGKEGMWPIRAMRVLIWHRKRYELEDGIVALRVALGVAVAAEIEASIVVEAGRLEKDAALKEFEDMKSQKIREVETELSALENLIADNELSLANEKATLANDLGHFV